MGRRRLQKLLAQGLRVSEQLRRRGKGDPALDADLLELSRLIDAIQDEEASRCAQRIAERLKEASRSPWWRKIIEVAVTLVAAIFIAGVIRQTWFELYEIPTGSMRPTFKERDRVLVSKSAFGVNIPFTPGHVLFSPERIQRGSVVVVTAENLDLPDVDTMYFGIFPGKKRYVKRCAALPGDWVYFYGGDLFCLSADEKTLHRLQADPTIPHREYIPFISAFEGRVDVSATSPFSRLRTYTIKHLNQPLGRIEMHPDGTIDTTIPQDGTWVHEFRPMKELPHPCPRSIGEFWGISNFALCRLILPENLPAEAARKGYEDPKAVAWLELHHSPTLPQPGKIKRSPFPLVNTSTSWIPLRAEHCERLQSGLYTARVVAQANQLRRYYFETFEGPTLTLPSEIPDGTYEFYNGTALQIGFGGTASRLPSTHPIYPKSAKELAFWFNAGIDVAPECLNGTHDPTRFAYYRDGDLYVMGTPIFKKGEPVLKLFEDKEITRQAKDYTYFAFQDIGSPDTPPVNYSFFKQFGYKVPEREYLLLGDNPAMSLDSRFFGPVPEDNIQGTPVLLFWPFGTRWGTPLQPHMWPSAPTIAFFVAAGIGTGIYMVYQRRRTRRLLEALKRTTPTQTV
jgi:signal peptidase I